MAAEYLAYLAFVLAGTWALQRAFGIRLEPLGRLVKTLALVAGIFIAWDTWAVATGQWTFNPAFIIGWSVGNQPVEEIAFFFIVPVFYLTVWQIGKSQYDKKQARDGGRA